MLFEKFFDRPDCNLCRQIVGEMKLTCGNTAERHAFQAILCRQLQAGAIAGSQQLFVLFGHSPVDNWANSVQHIPARQIERGRDFRLTGGFGMALLFHQFRAGKPQFYTRIGVNGVINAAMVGNIATGHARVCRIDDGIALQRGYIALPEIQTWLDGCEAGNTIVAAASCEVPLMEHIRHMLWTTTPAYLVSIILYIILGFRFDGVIGGEQYESLLNGLASTFNFNVLLLIPPIVVFALVLTKKPALPAFAAGIASAVILGMIFQGQSFAELCTVMASGCTIDSGNDLVNTLIQRGGMNSMLSTVAIVIGAAVFAAPIRASGAAQVLFGKVEEIAKTPGRFAAACYIIHPIFQLVAVTYYVTYPVMGSFCAPVYDKFGLSRANLTRTFEDSGTVIAPLIPWGMAGSYITAQLGVVPSEYWQYMPMCYMCIVFGIILSLTGIGVKKADGTYVRPILWQKKSAKAAK